jgi:predicted 3-demethylubiquinone-9 3-methyltransferase (glyoxalase superfamily)
MPELVVTPFLMFQHGKASAALDFYLDTLPGARVEGLERYGSADTGPEGGIKAARLIVAGQTLRLFDSPAPHGFDFTPSISFFIDCTSEAQLRDLADRLGAEGGVLMPVGSYGFSQLFGWVADRFGVSWQLNLAESKSG